MRSPLKNKKLIWVIVVLILIAIIATVWQQSRYKSLSSNESQTATPKTDEPETPSQILLAMPSLPTITPTEIQVDTQSFSLSDLNTSQPDDILTEVNYYVGGGGPLDLYCQSKSDDLYIETVQLNDKNVPTIEIGHYWVVTACGWGENENVEIKLFRPDGTVEVSNLIASLASEGLDFEYGVTFKKYFSVLDDLGQYKLVFRGGGGEITAKRNVIPPSTASVSYVVGQKNDLLVMVGFAQNENIRFFVYKADHKDKRVPFVGWQKYKVNEKGFLILDVPKENSFGYFFVVIGEESGEISLDRINPDMIRSWPSIEKTFLKCSNYDAARLKNGKSGRVTYTNGLPINVRDLPGLATNVISTMAEGSEFLIIDGPQCHDEMVWWKVEFGNGLIGWVAEGDNKSYFIEPLEN